MPAQITANQWPLAKVFSNDYLFEIPYYQRPYSWREEHVSTLLDDLLNGLARDKDDPYFLGSVVLIKDEDDPKSQVVDGQQRLTTLTVLLCVLRELAEEGKKKHLEPAIREDQNPVFGTEERFRITLRKQDREFFQGRIQTPGRLDSFLSEDPVGFSDSQKLLQGNTRYLNREVSSLSVAERDALATYVIQNCCLVVVSASNGESAHRIFEVMNDRGLDLSPTDILKSGVLSQIPYDSQAGYAQKWETYEEELGRDNFRALFAHIRMIYRREKQRNTLQAEFRENVLSRYAPQQFVDEVLEPYAEAYGILSDASYESSEDPRTVNRLLRHLKRTGNADWIPPAMLYFHKHGKDRAGILTFTKDLERLAYGLFIRRANVNERIRRYAEVIGAIEQGADLSGEASPLQLKQDEKTDILHRLDSGIYNMPLLMRLNSLLYEGEPPDDPPWATSIEHVLPQNPSADSEWMRNFPDETERVRWTHSLANLVLLSRRKNSQASNWDFKSKKEVYFLPSNGISPFALTNGVANEPEWTPAVLERRQRDLINALKGEWRLD